MSRAPAGPPGPKLDPFGETRDSFGMDRRLRWVPFVSLLCACAGPPKPEPFHYREAQDPEALPEPSASASEPLPEAPVVSAEPTEPAVEVGDADTGGGESLGTMREAPPLPAELDGGSITRPELQAVLSEGIPRFLRKVHTEPMLNAKGRFVGWRLLALFPDDPRGAAWLIRPGDVVLRVNGHGIERPEQFQNVWNSMATSSELVFQVLRGDQTSEIRYRIE